jgi:hypothetical protein
MMVLYMCCTSLSACVARMHAVTGAQTCKFYGVPSTEATDDHTLAVEDLANLTRQVSLGCQVVKVALVTVQGHHQCILL